jgi:hypothetical protein
MKKKHLTESGLVEIVSIKSALNLGLSPKLEAGFPTVKKIVRPEFRVNDAKLDPN